MMTMSVTAQSPVVDPSGPSSTKAQPQKSVSAPVTDTVQISSSAVAAAKAAVEESTETAAETAKEAQKGDPQAQRLMAKTEAAKAAR